MSVDDEVVILFLKGSSLPGQRKDRIGHCIKSQRVWMIMKLKENHPGNKFKFELRFIDENTKKTDENFKKICSTMTPALVHGEVELQDVDDIATYLAELPENQDDSGKPKYQLESDDPVANALAGTATPMSHLGGWIKNTDAAKEDRLSKKFYNCLGEINHTLGRIKEKGVGPFLCGEQLMFPDCILLPKLYHARIAALYTKGYDFTKSDPRDPDSEFVFRNIANYLKAAQDSPAFRETCPSEKEIQEKWKNYRGKMEQKRKCKS